LLGDPDEQSSDGALIYGLGPDPSFGIDLWVLYVDFDHCDVATSTRIDVY